MPIHDDALDATMSAMRFLLYVRNDDGTYNKPQEIKGSITISPDVVEPMMWWGTDGLLYIYCDWMV